MSFLIKALNSHNYPLSPEVEDNLKELSDRFFKLQQAYGRPLVITSGLRSDEQQKQLIAAGKSTATKSNHLIGKAVDVSDADGALHAWAKENTAALESIGFWMEERQGNWQHFQTVPPKSNKRWFSP